MLFKVISDDAIRVGIVNPEPQLTGILFVVSFDSLLTQPNNPIEHRKTTEIHVYPNNERFIAASSSMA
jgi:hypothetical protein